jgi:hypothetical protein
MRSATRSIDALAHDADLQARFETHARAFDRRLCVVLTIDEAQGVLACKTADPAARRALAKIQCALAGSAA